MCSIFYSVITDNIHKDSYMDNSGREYEELVRDIQHSFIRAYPNRRLFKTIMPQEKIQERLIVFDLIIPTSQKPT